MSSTTIETTQSTSTLNPFEAARKLAEQREQEEAAKLARQNEARQNERQQREAEQKLRDFQRNAHRWVEDFLRAVAKSAIDRKWKPAAITEAETYATTLVLQSDRQLPTIDPGIAKIIHSKFAYGLALDQKRRQIIPENFFNGQRQDWFPALYERKLTEVH